VDEIRLSSKKGEGGREIEDSKGVGGEMGIGIRLPPGMRGKSGSL
jgi:hypothetical protein